MKCPACVKAGKTSRFIEQRLPHHLTPDQREALVERFYDEDGTRHVHDAHVVTIVMTCSNNHSYRKDMMARCPVRNCAWNEQPLVKAQDEPIGA